MNVKKLIAALQVISKSIKDANQQKIVMKSVIESTTGKALDADTLSLLDQAMAIFAQIQQMVNGGTPSPASEAVENAGADGGSPSMGDEEEEEEMAGKELNPSTGADTGKPSDGSGSAEERLDDLPSETLDASTAIGKALALLNGGKEKPAAPAQKSDLNSQILVGTIQELAQVVKSLKTTQDQQTQFIEDFLSSSGVSEQLEIAQKSAGQGKKTNKSGAGVGSGDETTVLLSQIAKSLDNMQKGAQAEKDNYFGAGNSQLGEARKSFGSVVGSLLDPNIKGDPDLRK